MCILRLPPLNRRVDMLFKKENLKTAEIMTDSFMLPDTTHTGSLCPFEPLSKPSEPSACNTHDNAREARCGV